MKREEAIKLVKRIKGAMVYTEEEKEALETLIPELRESESEDKKFQKYILKACKECVEANDNGLELSMSTTKKLLSYLEKQKAKERFDRMAPIYNDKESFESALEKAWKYYNESASRTVDSFEDDYIECVFSKGFREGFLYKEKQKEEEGYEAIPVESTLEYKLGFKAGKESEKQKEQKPLITGNDFGWIDELKHDLKHPEELDQKVDDVLKQKKGIRTLEWSEEDESQLDDIEKAISNYFDLNHAPQYHYWLEQKLKSLRSQIIDSSPLYTIEQVDEKVRETQEWKPSKEQMDALKEVAYNIVGTGTETDVHLVQLYEQLKTL